MSLNCAEIDLVLSELDLDGSFIQEIVQPGFDSLALFTYKGPSSSHPGGPKTIFICLSPGACRIHSTQRRIPKTDRPLRFMEFLRSRVRGSRITSVRQIDSNRIIHFSLSSSTGPLSLYVRLWSGAANIICVDESGIIQDVFFRRPKREELSGKAFSLPQSIKAEDDQSVRWTVRDLPGTASFNERLDAWYAEHAKTLSRTALLAEATRRYSDRRSRLEAALNRLLKKRDSFLHADRFRHQGDILMANIHVIPSKAPWVELEDYENNNARLRITLNPDLNAQQNAASYYQQYKKAVSGLADLEDDIESTRRVLHTLEAEQLALEKEDNPLVIQKILRRQATPKQQLKKKYPALVFRKDGWIFLVGRTAAENDELLRRHVKGSDLWLHARDWPGSYVFIKNRPGKSVPLEILLDAGTLALFYSKGRKAGTGDLYYTQAKYLRRAKGARRGTVLPSNEKNLTVTLEDDRLKRLEACRDSD